MEDSYRLWAWKAKAGIALSGMAQHGVIAEKCKIDTLNPVLYLTGVCELIPCTDSARASIEEATS